MEALEWCFPCGHLYYAEKIRTWMSGRVAPRCPECQREISELIPYGMTLADLQARRAAEAAAARARVAAARQAYEPMRAAMIRERLGDEQEADWRAQALQDIGVRINRCSAAAMRCGAVLRGRVNVRSNGTILLRAERRLCVALEHVLQTHQGVLRTYIGNLRTIVRLYTVADERWQAAFAGGRGGTVEEAEGALAEIGTYRNQNVGLVAYLDAIRDGQPQVLDAAAYTVFRDDMEARAVGIRVAERYAGALRGFVRYLVNVDNVRRYAELLPRPAGQTVVAFMATVGRI